MRRGAGLQACWQKIQKGGGGKEMEKALHRPFWCPKNEKSVSGEGNEIMRMVTCDRKRATCV